VRERRADGPPDAEQVDLDRALEGRGVGGADHPAGRDARVRHDHVDAAEAVDGALHGVLERLDVRNVALEPGGVRPALRGHALELLWLEPHEGHVRTASGHPAGGLGPEAAGGTRDQHCLSARRPVHARNPIPSSLVAWPEPRRISPQHASQS
jgi:hypothetical protein